VCFGGGGTIFQATKDFAVIPQLESQSQQNFMIIKHTTHEKAQKAPLGEHNKANFWNIIFSVINFYPSNWP